jgi:enoyl-CoA hydratase/carnithine racemase
MAEERIVEQRSDGLVTLTLNRPERMNAWDSRMRSDLIDRLAAAAHDPEMRAVVVTGAGDRAFCAGQDLNELAEFGPEEADGWIDGFARLYRTVAALEIPVVAALNGVAAGSAFQFALLTDMRIGHAGVRMGQPEIRSGIASITGPWVMREMLGLSATRELTLSGRLMDADEALRLGALHELVPRGAVRERAEDVARDLGSRPRTAMQLIKRRFFEVLEPGLDEAIAAAKRYHRLSFESGEMQAETRRFLGRGSANG